MSLTPHQLVYAELLYIALRQPLGIALTCHAPPPTVRSQLNTARKACNDPDLSRIQIRASLDSPNTELWLVTLPEPPTPTDMDAEDED